MKGNMVIAGLPVEITRKSNLKNLYIRVNPPDGTITMSAPLNISDEEIQNFFLKRSYDISKARDRMLAQARQTKREYVSGEACYLWGKPYMLQVKYEGKEYNIIKSGNRLMMTVPKGASEDKRKKTLTEWYRSELKRVIPSILKQCENRVGTQANSCNIRNMKTRWGSCNTQTKRILINLQLVKKPVECLEYVLIHELVHLLERNHTNRFRSLVEKNCPNWKEARRLLVDLPLDYIGEMND